MTAHKGGVLHFSMWHAPQADDHFTERHPQEMGYTGSEATGWKWQLLSQSQGLTRVICVSHPLHPRSVSLEYSSHREDDSTEHTVRSP